MKTYMGFCLSAFSFVAPVLLVHAGTAESERIILNPEHRWAELSPNKDYVLSGRAKTHKSDLQLLTISKEFGKSQIHSLPFDSRAHRTEFSPDNRLLALIFEDHFKIVRLADRKVVLESPKFEEPYIVGKFSKNSKKFLSFDSRGRFVLIYDVEDSTKIPEPVHVKFPKKSQRRFNFNPDGTRLLALKVWNVHQYNQNQAQEIRELNGKLIASFETMKVDPIPNAWFTQNNTGSYFSPDGRYNVLLDDVSQLRIFDFQTGKLVVDRLLDYNTKTAKRKMVRFSPDGSRLFIGFGELFYTFEVGQNWESTARATCDLMPSMPNQKSGLFVLSADQKYVALCRETNLEGEVAFQVFKTNSKVGDPLFEHTAKIEKSWIDWLSFGKNHVRVDDDFGVRVLHVADGSPLKQWPYSDQGVGSGAISPTGETFASIGYFEGKWQLEVIDLLNSKETLVEVPWEHQDSNWVAGRIAFSKSGRYLVADVYHLLSDFATSVIFDVHSGKVQQYEVDRSIRVAWEVGDRTAFLVEKPISENGKLWDSTYEVLLLAE